MAGSGSQALAQGMLRSGHAYTGHVHDVEQERSQGAWVSLQLLPQVVVYQALKLVVHVHMHDACCHRRRPCASAAVALVRSLMAPPHMPGLPTPWASGETMSVGRWRACRGVCRCSDHLALSSLMRCGFGPSWRSGRHAWAIQPCGGCSGALLADQSVI